MEFVDKKINDQLNEELNPKIVKSFMGESAVESSMNRVQQHLDSDKGFFVISTHKQGMSEQDEIDKVRELRVDLTGNNKNERLGYIPLRGKYTREDNGEIEYEHSFFVPNRGQSNFKERALTLCRKFGQESILYSEKGKVYFLYQNGKMDFVGDHIRFVDEINKYWSKLKKGSHSKFRFAFESLYPINSIGLNVAHNWGELF